MATNSSGNLWQFGLISKFRGYNTLMMEPYARGGQPRRAGGQNMLLNGPGAREVEDFAQDAAPQELMRHKLTDGSVAMQLPPSYDHSQPAPLTYASRSFIARVRCLAQCQ